MWAFGYHQCRWSYGNEDQLIAVAEEFRSRNIPLECLWLDIDYMDGYRVFTFHPDRFGEISRTLQYLHRKGIRVVAIVDPGVKKQEGYFAYDEVPHESFSSLFICLDCISLLFFTFSFFLFFFSFVCADVSIVFNRKYFRCVIGWIISLCLLPFIFFIFWQGKQIDAFVKDFRNEQDVIGEVWPSPAVFPDFSQPVCRFISLPLLLLLLLLLLSVVCAF